MTLRIAIVVVVMAALAGAWWLLQILGIPADLSPDALAQWLKSQGAAGPLLLMLLMTMAVVIGPIPTLPVSATAGLAFGVLEGTAIAATGALLGAMAAFWIARCLGREVICKRFPDNPVLARDGSQRFLTIAILLTRLALCDCHLRWHAANDGGVCRPGEHVHVESGTYRRRRRDYPRGDGMVAVVHQPTPRLAAGALAST